MEREKKYIRTFLSQQNMQYGNSRCPLLFRFPNKYLFESISGSEISSVISTRGLTYAAPQHTIPVVPFYMSTKVKLLHMAFHYKYAVMMRRIFNGK